MENHTPLNSICSIFSMNSTSLNAYEEAYRTLVEVQVNHNLICEVITFICPDERKESVFGFFPFARICNKKNSRIF